MVSIQLLCVGKLKEKHFTAACEEYQKRLSAFCKLTVTELPEVRLPENPSQAQIDGALEKEGAAILAKLPKGGKLVALCVEGDLLLAEGQPHAAEAAFRAGSFSASEEEIRTARHNAALACGQQPPAELAGDTKEALLEWAVRHWQQHKIPTQSQILSLSRQG